MAWLNAEICRHTFCATGIAVYLQDGATVTECLLKPWWRTKRPRTTKLHDLAMKSRSMRSSGSRFEVHMPDNILETTEKLFAAISTNGQDWLQYWSDVTLHKNIFARRFHLSAPSSLTMFVINNAIGFFSIPPNILRLLGNLLSKSVSHALERRGKECIVYVILTIFPSAPFFDFCCYSWINNIFGVSFHRQ
jgi:hypothetical protein